MHSIWVSLKENVNCGSKLTDVIRRPCAKDKPHRYEENSESARNGEEPELVSKLILDQLQSYIQVQPQYYGELSLLVYLLPFLQVYFSLHFHVV